MGWQLLGQRPSSRGAPLTGWCTSPPPERDRMTQSAPSRRVASVDVRAQMLRLATRLGNSAGTGPIAGRHDRTPRRQARYGTVTGWMTTGPRVGLSSVAWGRVAGGPPGGVRTSTPFARGAGSTEQIGAAPPGAHTPNVNSPGVAVN